MYDDGLEDDFKLPQTLLLNNRSAVLVSGLQTARRDGWIVSGQMQQQPGVANQATQRGQLYVKACIVSGIDPGTTNSPTATIPQCRAMVCCGYIYSGVEVSVGQLIEPGPSGGSGAITRVNTAGTVTTGRVLGVVPTGAIWRWISLQGEYSASATAGTRSVQYRFRDASGNIFYRSINQAPTLSQKAFIAFVEGIQFAQFGTGVWVNENLAVIGPLPNRGLPAGYDLFAIDVGAIDGLDTITTDAQVEEWVIPN